MAWAAAGFSRAPNHGPDATHASEQIRRRTLCRCAVAVLTLRSTVLLLSGAADPAAAGRELLARRDGVLEEQRERQGVDHGSMGMGTAGGNAAGGKECAICMEEYDGQERSWASAGGPSSACFF